MNRIKITKPTILAALALTIVFLIDIFTPLGIAIGVLYVFCFLLLCRETKKVIFIFAIITFLLTITKIIVFFSPTTTYIAFSNRALTITVIAIVVVLALRHRTIIDKINEERSTYIKELEKMLFMTSHEVRKPIASFLGLTHLLESNAPLSNDEIKKIVHYLKSSALELDEFTKELTKFMSDIEKKEKQRQLTAKKMRAEV